MFIRDFKNYENILWVCKWFIGFIINGCFGFEGIVICFCVRIFRFIFM